MFPELVVKLGEIGYVDYILPTTKKLADAVVKQIKERNIVLMANHGTFITEENLRQVYHRTVVIEDAAKSLVAASVIGTPRFLTPDEVKEIKN